MYFYWAYGLIVKSGLFFPELLPLSVQEAVDVEILLGAVPDAVVGESDFVHDQLVITPVAYRLAVKGTAVYYAEGGKRIIIEPVGGHDPAALRLFCLSNVFAAVLHQQKKIPMHCSAILHHDQLVLFFGASGAGKSTTLASLIQRGYLPFSDDVCVPILDEEEQVQFYSSYPMMKYWKSNSELFNFSAVGNAHKLREDVEKYGLYFHERFITGHKKPVLAFFLQKEEGLEAVKVEAINGLDLFVRLDEHAYRAEYLRFSDLRLEHFTLLTTLSNQVKAYVISRPDDENSIGALADVIEEKIRESF